MSTLQDACEHLLEALSEAATIRADLGTARNRLGSAGAQVADTARGSGHDLPRKLLAQIDDASRRCQGASEQIALAEQLARGWATDAIGGAASGQAPDDSGAEANDRFAPSSAQWAFISSSASNANGVSFFSDLTPGDKRLKEFAKGIAPQDGGFLVAVHGNNACVGLVTTIDGDGNPSGHALLDPSGLAEVIRNGTNWSGEPIFLMSCSTGSDRPDGSCFAQDLADILGVEVTAPTDSAWSGIDESDSQGRPIVSRAVEYVRKNKYGEQTKSVRPEGPPYTGEWKGFRPR